ncbi:hypothetical protein BH20ACI2_BH20ACI2_14410 [soil metagenome]
MNLFVNPRQSYGAVNALKIATAFQDHIEYRFDTISNSG